MYEKISLDEHNFWTIGSLDHGRSDEDDNSSSAERRIFVQRRRTDLGSPQPSSDDDLPELIDDTDSDCDAKEDDVFDQTPSSAKDSEAENFGVLNAAFSRYERSLTLPSVKSAFFQELNEYARQPLIDSIASWLDEISHGESSPPGKKHQRVFDFELLSSGFKFDAYLKPIRGIKASLTRLWLREFVPYQIDIDFISTDAKFQVKAIVSPSYIAQTKAFKEIRGRLVETVLEAVRRGKDDQSEYLFQVEPFSSSLAALTQEITVYGHNVEQARKLDPVLTQRDCLGLIYDALQKPLYEEFRVLLRSATIFYLGKLGIQGMIRVTRETAIFQDINVLENPLFWITD